MHETREKELQLINAGLLKDYNNSFLLKKNHHLKEIGETNLVYSIIMFH